MEVWGIVIAILLVVGWAWKAYMNWERQESYRSINRMDKRDRDR